MLKKPDMIEFQSWGVFAELLSEKLAEKYIQGKYSIKLTDPQLGLELIGELVDDDYEFIESLGDLDECNGMTVDDVYGYYITDNYPYVVGCFSGSPDSSFNKR